MANDGRLRKQCHGLPPSPIGNGSRQADSLTGGKPKSENTARGKLSIYPELLREHESIARARDVRPVAVEIGDQAFHVVALHRTLERGVVVELIRRLMHGGIGQTPEPPGLPDAERFRRIRQMRALVPFVERGAFGGIAHRRTDDEKGCGHCASKERFPGRSNYPDARPCSLTTANYRVSWPATCLSHSMASARAIRRR